MLKLVIAFHVRERLPRHFVGTCAGTGLPRVYGISEVSTMIGPTAGLDADNAVESPAYERGKPHMGLRSIPFRSASRSESHRWQLEAAALAQRYGGNEDSWRIASTLFTIEEPGRDHPGQDRPQSTECSNISRREVRPHQGAAQNSHPQGDSHLSRLAPGPFA